MGIPVGLLRSFTAELAGAGATDRPLAVDICCGRGGWTRGLAAAGWRVVGIDAVPQDAYPTSAHVSFVQGDIRTLRAHELRLAAAPLLVCASPPCQGFSTLRAANQSPPRAEAFELVAHCLRLIAELRPKWWGIENVRGAWKWWGPLLGDPDRRCEPYYVWGNLPDAFRPAGRYPSKLRYRDPGRRSEIPASLARELAEAVLEAEGIRAGARAHCETAAVDSPDEGPVQAALAFPMRAYDDEGERLPHWR